MLTRSSDTCEVNMQVVNAEDAQIAMQQKQQSVSRSRPARSPHINQIHQIGAQATACMNATETANDAQQPPGTPARTRMPGTPRASATTCSIKMWCRTTSPVRTLRNGTRPRMRWSKPIHRSTRMCQHANYIPGTDY